MLETTLSCNLFKLTAIAQSESLDWKLLVRELIDSVATTGSNILEVAICS